MQHSSAKVPDVPKDRFQQKSAVGSEVAQYLLTIRTASHIFPNNNTYDFWLCFLVVVVFFNKEHRKHFQQKTSLCMMLLCVNSLFLHHSRMATPSVPVPPRKTYLDAEIFIFSYGYPCEYAFCKYTSTAVFYFSV